VKAYEQQSTQSLTVCESQVSEKDFPKIRLACFRALGRNQNRKETSMRAIGNRAFHLVIAVLLTLSGPTVVCAQDGKLKIHARPSEAYVFVDGQAMGEASRTLTLAPGNHRIDLYNYGYVRVSRDVSVPRGATTHLNATLEPIASRVSGPWGSITLEGADRDAIFLNGRTPQFLVGHGDEFNHEWWWKQELIVPPGTHQLTVVREGKEIWSGPVEVLANERVIVDIPQGVRKTCGLASRRTIYLSTPVPCRCCQRNRSSGEAGREFVCAARADQLRTEFFAEVVFN
jgi:hypothetical protein